MKKILLSLTFALLATVGFSQSNDLTVWNFTSAPLFVKAGASTTTCDNFSPTSAGTVAILPNSFFSFPAPGAITDVWYGVKATNSLTSPSAYGAFFSPCNPCGVDNTNGLNIQWDVANGCFRARIF